MVHEQSDVGAMHLQRRRRKWSVRIMARKRSGDGAMHLQKGKRNGLCEKWYENGKLKERCTYKDGVKIETVDSD
jgi:hypothetical protein